MSYEWIRRRKRYLSFRYLFPEFVVPWIQFKRCLLRVMWFFTHPVDEFFEDLGELIAWPFVATAKLCTWVLNGIGQFFKDLFDGIESFFRYVGRLPVWTGAAIAGTLGIVMTILLFFVQVATFDPVPLSAGAAMAQQPEQRPAQLPQPLLGSNTFSPFDGAPSAPPGDMWRPETEQLPSMSMLQLSIDRIGLPYGFDSRKRIQVVSTAVPPQTRPAWSQFDRMSTMDGWSLTRIERARQLLNFTPYVSRQSMHSRITPSWVTTAASVSPYLPVEGKREPAVSITRTVPKAATVGSSMNYELLVSNTGAEPLDCVTVHEAVSAIDRVMDVDPPANVIENTLVWNVTNLQPRENRRISIELRPDRLIPVTGGSTVRVKTGVAAVSHVTEPTRPAPAITPEQPQELKVSVPEPLPEPAASQNMGVILPAFDEDPLPEPPPAQTEPSFTFEPLPAKPPKPAPAIMPLLPVEHEEPAIVKLQPIEKSQVTEDGRGVPIFFEMRTPSMVDVEDDVATTFVIRNPGTAELTNLVILVKMNGQLDHHKGRILEHRIQQLAPGAEYRTRLTTRAILDGNAQLRSNLTCAEELNSTLEANIEVSPPAKPATELSHADLPDDAGIFFGRPLTR